MTMNLEPAEIFKILGVDTRVKIINLLKARGPLGANEIASQLRITSSAVSQHLKILKHAGLVRNERKGYWIPYEIDHVALAHCKELVTNVCNCGCRGTCQAQGQGARSAEEYLAVLRKRENELLEELEAVQARIREMQDNA